jgi:hypothetical protein
MPNWAEIGCRPGTYSPMRFSSKHKSFLWEKAGELLESSPAAVNLSISKDPWGFFPDVFEN